MVLIFVSVTFVVVSSKENTTANMITDYVLTITMLSTREYV